MRTYSVPAAYRRHLEASLALAVAEVGRDTSRRSDEDPRVQALATVPDHYVEHDAPGRIVVAVLTEAEAVVLDQLRQSAAA